MSYARFGEDSDVYVIDTGEQMECCWCCLKEPREAFSSDRKGMLTHLEEHIKAGHKVPDYATDRIKYELEMNQTVFGKPLIEGFNTWGTWE